MFEIDRSLMVVKPKQPFLDWAQSVEYEEGLSLDEHIRDDSLVYLIPQIWEKADHLRVLKLCYEVVFEAELEAWYTDPAVWPQNRDLKMFLEWFDVEFHSLVFDLSDGPIQVIEHESEQPLDPKLSEDTEPEA